jgi:hypothetical protein
MEELIQIIQANIQIVQASQSDNANFVKFILPSPAVRNNAFLTPKPKPIVI